MQGFVQSIAQEYLKYVFPSLEYIRYRSLARVSERKIDYLRIE